MLNAGRCSQESQHYAGYETKQTALWHTLYAKGDNLPVLIRIKEHQGIITCQEDKSRKQQCKSDCNSVSFQTKENTEPMMLFLTVYFCSYMKFYILANFQNFSMSVTHWLSFNIFVIIVIFTFFIGSSPFSSQYKKGFSAKFTNDVYHYGYTKKCIMGGMHWKGKSCRDDCFKCPWWHGGCHCDNPGGPRQSWQLSGFSVLGNIACFNIWKK